ncbi:Uncharacterized protein dnm_027270 [Desulfonema magnum]|uniref:PLAT domain-containing protein n=1 Tax=Desulfonema magnum TaxID=45655 RepID=A0A975BKB7_9BACT|nr:Uncharacterized protein dnm_027270 [Desulfonema magnum]
MGYDKNGEIILKLETGNWKLDKVRISSFKFQVSSFKFPI